MTHGTQDAAGGGGPPPRYCPHCGEIFTALPVASVATLLGEFRGLREAGQIGPNCYGALRATYERRLIAVRPPRAAETAGPFPFVATPPARRYTRRPPVGEEASTGVPVWPAAPAAPERDPLERVGPVAPEAPVRPRRDLGRELAQWTARRQADILLYLGAFFVSVAAFIFVGYQGNALGGPARIMMLLGYTVGFLALGVMLPRWERVREAGAVFLLLGAFLVPLNFVALYTQTSGPTDIADSFGWLVAASTSAALYLALAGRGYGRLYAVPGAGAALIAWGALAATANLPHEWWPAWYVGASAAVRSAALTMRPPTARWARIVAESTAVLALIVAQSLVFDRDFDTGQLPAAYALATAGIVACLVLRRRRLDMALLPAAAAVTGLAAWWSAFGLAPVWYGCFVALAGAGYLAVAAFDARERARDWATAAAVCCGFALLLTHRITVRDITDIDRAALPAVYALVLVVAGAAFARWRWREALALVPALAAGVGGSVTWAVWGMPPLGLAPWAALSAAGYLALAEVVHDDHWPFRWVAGGGAALALIWAHLGAQTPGVQTIVLPATYAALLVGAVWDGVRRRDAAMGLAPPLAVGLVLTSLWAGSRVPLSWIGSLAAVMGLAYLALAEIDRPRRDAWRPVAGLAGGAGICWAHVAAAQPDMARLALPLTYTIVLVGAAWDTMRGRSAGLAALPALGALAGSTLLWAVGAGTEWWIYPGFVAAIVVLATERWWSRRDAVADLGDMYTLAPAVLLPVGFLFRFEQMPVHGLVSFLLGAGVVLATAVLPRWTALRGTRTSEAGGGPGPERLLRHWTAAALAFAVAAYFNAWVGLEGDARAWVFAAIGMAAWGGLALAGTRPWLFGVLAPVAVAAMAVGGVPAVESAGTLVAVLSLGVAGAAAAFPATRRWLLWSVAEVFGACALGAVWWKLDLDPATLPFGYAVAGLALWAGLATLRRYEQDERGLVITGLSWGPFVLALGAAVVLIVRRGIEPGMDEALARTREWPVLALMVFAASAAATLEGVRLGLRSVWTAGSAGLVTAALMGIAIIEPSNVQAYTIPVGLYLIGLGLSARRSPELFGPHMLCHEAAMALGVLFLALPPAGQSFEPNGARYGLELIGIGLVVLAAGFALAARWLVAGGVLTLGGVAVRWLALFSTEAPGWLLLGIVGTALLAAGMLLLGQREWWDRTRTRITRWWQTVPAVSGPTDHA